MPPRRKSALEELIRTGLVADGELLRYKSKQGALLAVGRAREGGIEVEGVNKLLGYTAFEDVSGSRYHRPAEHTHTTRGRTLQSLALLAAGSDGGGGGGAGGRGRQQQQVKEPKLDLLEDENDDMCYICGLGGNLICCETCPAVFHAPCVDLEAPPAGDFFCPQCKCTQCGGGGSEGVMPTGCQWLSCQHFSGLQQQQQLSRPHIGIPGSSSGGAGSTATKAEPADGAAAQGPAAVGAEPMQVDAVAAAAAAAKSEAATAAAQEAAAAAAEAGLADFSRLVAAATADWQVAEAPAQAAEAAARAKSVAATASADVAVYCPVSLRWGHLRCVPPEFAAALRQGTSQPCISSQEALTASTRLAAACSAGLLPLGSIAEGARAGGGAAAEGGVDARAPLPVSLLVVRGAAAAAPGDCRGHAPAYSQEQRQQLRVALSAALHVVHSCYAPVPDSRTGADILPWLLRGAVLAGGEADYSGMHTALLYTGQVVAGVALFRSFGALAELPLLAVRPELQRRNGLGRLLLAAVERLLLQAGAQWLLMPAFTPAGLPYLPQPPPPSPAVEGQQAGQPPQQPVPAEAAPLLQSKWGYSLAPTQQLLAASSHPMVRLPGMLLACKRLSNETVLPPPRLPQRLLWSGAVGDARPLLRDGMLASVAPAHRATAAAAAAAAAAKASGSGRGGKPGRPPKPPAPAVAGAAPTIKKQQPAQAALQPAQQVQQQQQVQPPAQQQVQQQQQPEQMMAMLYQQQMLAQQAAASQQGAAPQAGQAPSQEQLMALYQQQQQMAYLQQLHQQQPHAYALLLQQQMAHTQQQQGGAPAGYAQAPQQQPPGQ